MKLIKHKTKNDMIPKETVKMSKTVIVKFIINGVKIETEALVPQMKDGINHDNMIILNAKSNIKKKLGIDIYELLNIEHYEEMQEKVFIDKSSYEVKSSELV